MDASPWLLRVRVPLLSRTVLEPLFVVTAEGGVSDTMVPAVPVLPAGQMALQVNSEAWLPT